MNPLARLGFALAIAASLTGVVYVFGYRTGRNQTQGQYERRIASERERLARTAEIASRTVAARLVLEADRNRLAMKLEDAARTDPDAGRPALGVDSVHRLARR